MHHSGITVLFSITIITLFKVNNKQGKMLLYEVTTHVTSDSHNSQVNYLSLSAFIITLLKKKKNCLYNCFLGKLSSVHRMFKLMVYI